jgi:chromosomal replication initiation ATPase DnaA
MSELLSLYRGAINVGVRYPTMREIAAEICAEYDITLEDLRGERTARWVSKPRQAFMWRCREVRCVSGKRRFSAPQIAKFLNKRDHVCVLHGARAHEARLAQEMRDSHVDDRKCRSADAQEAA